MMSGLDYLGAEEVGFDWMSLVKGASGALQGAGGLMSGGGGGGGQKDPAAAAIEKMKLEEAKAKAESSALTMKIVLGIVAGFAAIGGVVLLVRR